MEKRWTPWLAVFVVTAATALLLRNWIPAGGQPDPGIPSLGSSTVRAAVVEIIEAGEITLGERVQPYQIARVELLEGEYAGLVMEIDYGKREVRSDDYRLAAGQDLYASLPVLQAAQLGRHLR